MKELSDEELMLRLQKGDKTALAELYERHSKKVWAYINKRVPREYADDLFQDCFVKLVEKKDSWHQQPFVLWLYVVLRNLIIDFYRKVKIEKRVLDKIRPLNDSRPEADLDELVADMPPETSKLLKEFFQGGWSYKELAQKYELSEISLRKRMSRAIAFLRKGE
jgi:RNA polymerase sigma-70 factor (ECF subfamily)